MRVPDEAQRLLTSAGWCRGTPLAAWAHTPAAHRSPDGQLWQVVDGWWIDTAALVTVRARRMLVPDGTATGGRPRLRPAGKPWTVQAAAHRLIGPPPAVQRWSRPRRAGGGPSPGATDVRTTNYAMDLLPRAVQDSVGRPTGQGAIRTYPETGGYCDQVYAYRRIREGDDQLIAVSAVRQAGAFPDPDTAIEAADWHITTYHAQVSTATHRQLGLL